MRDDAQGETATPARGAMPTLQIVAISAGILATLALLTAAKIASAIVIPTLMAGLAALALSPMVRWLERRRIGSGVAAALVVGATLASISAGGYVLAPSAEEWGARAPDAIRTIEYYLRDLGEDIEEKLDAATPGGGGAQEDSATEKVVQSGQTMVSDAFLNAPALIGSLLYASFLSYFLLAERASAYRSALALAPTPVLRLRLARAFRALRGTLSRYFFLISVINLALGALSATAFWLFGLPNPMLWGAMVALLNYMPFLGPMAANVVIFCVGVVTYRSGTEALYPVAALAMMNMIEGQLVTPTVVGKSLRLGGLAVFVAIAFGAWLWGPLGALMAPPLLIALRCIGQELAGRGSRRAQPALPRTASAPEPPARAAAAPRPGEPADTMVPA